MKRAPLAEEVIAERKRQQREKMRAYFAANPEAREKRRQYQREYMEKIREAGLYDEYKKNNAARGRQRTQEQNLYQRIKNRERNKRWRDKRASWESNILRRAKERAKAKDLPFNLTAEDVAVPDVCPVLGIALAKNERSLKETSPSLDRIIPAKGYVKGNVRVISARANRLKCDGTAAEMKLIYEDLLRIENGG